MLTQPQNGNGTPPAVDDAGEVLPFLSPDCNSYRRISVNAAWTDRRTTGHYDVGCVLFSECLQDLEQRTPIENPDLDVLEVQRLRAAVEQQLQGVPEIVDAARASFKIRAQLLRDLAARKPLRVTRRLQEIVTQTVNAAIAPLRQSLQAQLKQSPFTCLGTIDRTDRALREISLPTPDFSAQRHLLAGMHAMESLPNVSALPETLRALLTASLNKRCEHEWQAALDAVVEAQLGNALQQALQELPPVFQELRASQVNFRRNVETVREHLEREQIAARQRTVHARSSVFLELETPDQEQLLTGIRDRHRCEDRVQLIRLFGEKLQFALNEAANQRFPLVSTPATLVELLTQLPAREIGTGVLAVVAGMVGDIHTVYTAVRALGVVEAARELHDRAGPLCQLSSRDHVRLNVETHMDLVVRLPRPRGVDDAEIAEQLRDAFRDMQSTAQFVLDDNDTEITVVRTLVGFPIGIEAGCEPMLIDYAASARQGHHPHLFGILAESPDGQPLPELLALAQTIRHS